MAKTMRFSAATVVLFILMVLVGALAPLDAAQKFRRGDSDANGVLDITDALHTLGYLFQGSPERVPCEDAADANDDGVVNITDPVGTLFFLFSSGSPPPPPSGEARSDCGVDPTADDLACESFAPCPNSRPIADCGSDLEAFVGDTVTLDGAASSDADGDPLTFRWSLAGVPPGSGAPLVGETSVSPAFVPDVEGAYAVQLIVNDGDLDSEPDTCRIGVTVFVPPDRDGDGLSDAREIQLGTDPDTADTDGDGLDDGEEVDRYLTQPLAVDTDGDGLSDGSEVKLHGTSPIFADTDGDTFDDAEELAAGSDANDAGSTPIGNLPPDPSAVAPPLDLSVPTTISDATEFLYSGQDPIQTGVAPDAIVKSRAAVLRGRVVARQGGPLPAVTVKVLGHPELGSTLTRPDGMFDLVVNGGGALIVQYERAGYLTAQRQIEVPWQDYRFLPDVVLIPVDPEVTAIDLAGPVQVARGSPVTDGDGIRQATLVVPQGTAAEMVLPDGSKQPLGTLTVRATEYTVGEVGPQAMPGDLPPASAYTYCVELTADEAMAAGATDVRFSTPLPFYVENFLGFPVGTTVPLGSYDRTRGMWFPAESGKVIKILSVTDGAVDLDTDGDEVADGPAALAALSITGAERQQLAALYTPGKSLWRVRIPHFTPWDLNWPYGPPDGAVGPDGDPEADSGCEACPQTGNSVIEVQNQILGESVGVVGTPFGLHYSSDRTPGRKTAYTLEIPLSGSEVPASLEGINLSIQLAGRLFRQDFGPSPNQRFSFAWDGKDAYGRTLQGPQFVKVRIGYCYKPVYNAGAGFGQTGKSEISGSRARNNLILFRLWEGWIGTFDARAAGLGGWTLSPHHAYVRGTQQLYRGDGGRETARALGPTISTVAGTGLAGNTGERVPATEAQLVSPSAVAVGPDGSLYIASPQCCIGASSGKIRRVDPDGIITTVAGTGNFCTIPACGDGGPATQAALLGPQGIAVGPDQTLYIAEGGAHWVRKVGPDGIILRVAGTGVAGFSGDDGPAHLARLNAPRSVAVGPDSAVYIADSANSRIRRIATDGIITTVAGGGNPADGLGDGGFATSARTGNPTGLAVGGDGSLYIADGLRVRRVTPDGIIRTIAGTGVSGFSGDGSPATEARFGSIFAVTVGPDDSVYVVDQPNHRIRWFRPGGAIDTLAGTGLRATSGDTGPARQAQLQDLHGIAAGPDGAVYITQAFNNVRVRRITPITDRFVAGEVVPSADGSEVYIFTAGGRHVRTLDALTGALRYEFAYDDGGGLASVTDRNGNVTTIERDAAGKPMAIVGPFGQITELEVDPNGYLSRIANPAGEAVDTAHGAEGLLGAVRWPGGQSSSYSYDSLGRLEAATDPTGATKRIDRSGTNKKYTVTWTTPLDKPTTYTVERLYNDDLLLTSTDPAGVEARALIGQDGIHTSTLPDGTRVDLVLGPDPRWGMRAPIAASLTVTTPGGKVLTTTTQRTVTLADPDDLLSLRTLTDTVTINGRVSTSVYDATTRTLIITSPAGRRYTFAADERGRPVHEQIADLEPSSFTYDVRGRLATHSQGVGAGSRVALMEYGNDGFLESLTDAVSRTTSFKTDLNGRVTEQTLPDGGQVRWAYDLNDNVRGLTPPGRSEHTFSYTPRDEAAAYTPPAVGVENSQTRYTYDPDRQPLRTNLPDGRAAGFEYDAAGRLSLIDLVSGDLGYGYDEAGRLKTLTTPLVSLGYAYDGGLPTGTTWSGAVAGSVTRTYDNDFRETSISVNGSNPIATQYDADSLPVRVGDLVPTRDAQSGLVTATALGASADAASYFTFGHPATYTASQTGSAVYSEEYTRDLMGRITTRSETTGGATRVFGYGYDLAGRLIEVRLDGVLTASYAYDANGNRLSRTDSSGTIGASYDAQDRLIQYGAATYDHTPNGERENKSAGDLTTIYQYDALGNLTGVILPDGTEIEYVLDGQNRRVGRRVNGALVQGFLYQDRLRPIAELDGAGAVVSRFVYATDGYVPDYFVRGGSTYRIISDQLGSPRLVLDAATGQIAQQMDHDEFGRVTLDSNPGFQPFGFAGGLYDRQTGLVHFGAREYDPETGRWTTKDSIGFAGGDTNLYGYVFNDPVNRVDPEGRASTLQGCVAPTTPAAAEVCAAVVGPPSAAYATYPQQINNAVQSGGAAAANAVSNVVCRASTIPGVVPFRAMTAVARIPDPPGHFMPYSPMARWYYQALADTAHYRDSLSLAAQSDAAREIAELVEFLFGHGL